jgi:hypothetical protein
LLIQVRRPLSLRNVRDLLFDGFIDIQHQMVLPW